MSVLSVFVANCEWPKLLLTISGIAEASGIDDSDDLGARHVWKFEGLDIVAIDDPGLEDDQGIPFSQFHSQVDLIITGAGRSDEIMMRRQALGIFLVQRLRELSCRVSLINNLQTEIVVP